MCRALPVIGRGRMGLSVFDGPPTEQETAAKLLYEVIETA
jgi:hypothetical protein